MSSKPFKTNLIAFFLLFVSISFCHLSEVWAQATLNQTSSEYYYRTGLELFDKQKYGAAQKAFQEYIRLENLSGKLTDQSSLKVVDAQYYSSISALYLFNPDAETQIDRFIADHPQHPKAIYAYYELGQFYFTKKDYPKTIEYLAKVNSEDLNLEQVIDYKFKLGYAYFSKQDFEKAGRMFDDLKRTNHKYTSAANYYAGYINYKQGKYEAALKDLKNAEKDPAYQSEVPYMVANVYYKQQRYDELLAYTESIIGEPEVDASAAEKPVGAKKPGSRTPTRTTPSRSASKTTTGKSTLNTKQSEETPAEENPAGSLVKALIKNTDELFLLTAEAYYRQGNYAKAAPYFKQYAASKGTRAKPSPDVQYRIAYAQYLTKDYAAAAESFKSIASSRDSIGQYSAYYLGMSYLQTNNKPFALQAFNQARKAKFNNQVQEESAFNYAKVLGDLGNNAEAITAVKEFLKAYPNSRYESEANELLSESYLNTSNYAEAIAHIENLKSRTPRIEAAYQRVTYNQGVTNFNNERLPEAITFFDKSLRSPVEGDLVLAANFWKGEAYSVNRNYDEAINSYAAVFRKSQEGLKASTDDYALKSRYGIGYAYYNRKEYDKAAVHFREYVGGVKTTNKLNYTDALVRLADCYYVQKNYDEAVRTYDLALAQNTVDKDYAFYQKGIILGIQGKDAEAKQALDRAAQSSQSRYADGALFQKAQLTFEKGDYSGAIAQYTQLIEGKPNSSFVPFALQRRAIAYSNLQQYDKAVVDYQRILNQYGTSKVANSALLGLQEALNNAGRSEEFNAALAKYKQNNPQDSSLENVEFEAAKSLYFGEKYPKAVESFLNYMKTYPSNALAYDAKFYLGESYYRLNDFTNAVKYHQAVIADNRSPNVSRSVSRLAELEFASKNYPGAIGYYLTSLATARNKKEQANAWNGLMESYFNLNKYDSVLYYADEIINKGGATVNAQNKALLYRGKSLYAQGQYDQAVDEFLRTVNSAKDENGAEAQYLIGEAWYKQNKYKESLDALFELNQKFSSYERWRGRAFLLIADNYVAMDEAFQAKATLNSIIERSPDQQIVEEAKVKLKALEEKQ